jgi:hypothetical protein
MPEDALQPIKLGKPELDAPEYSDVTHVMLTYNWQPLPPQSWIGHFRQAMDAAGYDTGSNRMAMLRGRS